MKATILPTGFLKITANNEDRAELSYTYRDTPGGYPQAEDYVRETLQQLGWEFVNPEWVAALTDAPIITNDLRMDENMEECQGVGDVWWFPGYMIDDPWEQLKNKGRVFFDPEENNKSLPKPI
jgi:hypothetical protein